MKRMRSTGLHQMHDSRNSRDIETEIRNFAHTFSRETHPPDRCRTVLRRAQQQFSVYLLPLCSSASLHLTVWQHERQVSPFNSLSVALWQMALSGRRWKLYGDVKTRRRSAAQAGGVRHPHGFDWRLSGERSQVMNFSTRHAFFLACDANTGDSSNIFHAACQHLNVHLYAWMWEFEKGVQGPAMKPWPAWLNKPPFQCKRWKKNNKKTDEIRIYVNWLTEIRTTEGKDKRPFCWCN